MSTYLTKFYNDAGQEVDPKQATYAERLTLEGERVVKTERFLVQPSPPTYHMKTTPTLEEAFFANDSTLTAAGAQGAPVADAPGPATVNAATSRLAAAATSRLAESQFQSKVPAKGEHQVPAKGEQLTGRAIHLGAMAHAQFKQGKNPAGWVADEDIWDQAKTAASKTYSLDDDAYWPVVAHIYESMGGTVKDEGGKANVSLDEALLAPSLSNEYDESQHPRDEGGKWSAMAFAISSDAHAASAKAEQDGSAASHQAAESLHRDAVNMHTSAARSSTDEDVKARHEGLAESHGQLADYHERQAGILATKNIGAAEADPSEHVSQNTGHGFYGTRAGSHPKLTAATGEHPVVAKEFETARNHLVAMHGGTHAQAREYLDSTYGRHLADTVRDERGNIKAAIARPDWAKHYAGYVKHGFSNAAPINHPETGRFVPHGGADAVTKDAHKLSAVANEAGAKAHRSGFARDHSAAADAHKAAADAHTNLANRFRKVGDIPGSDRHAALARIHVDAAKNHTSCVSEPCAGPPAPANASPSLDEAITSLPNEYDESQHPREEHGRWSAAAISATSDAHGKSVAAFKAGTAEAHDEAARAHFLAAAHNRNAAADSKDLTDSNLHKRQAEVHDAYGAKHQALREALQMKADLSTQIGHRG